MSDPIGFFNKQFFLDLVASSGSLTEEYWLRQDISSNERKFRPGKKQMRWLLQVWDDQVKKDIYLKVRQDNGNYKKERRIILRDPSWTRIPVPGTFAETTDFYNMQEKVSELPSGKASVKKQSLKNSSPQGNSDLTGTDPVRAYNNYRNNFLGRKDVITPFYILQPPLPENAASLSFTDSVENLLPAQVKMILSLSENVNNMANLASQKEMMVEHAKEQLMEHIGESVLDRYGFLIPEWLRELYAEMDEILVDSGDDIETYINEAQEGGMQGFQQWLKEKGVFENSCGVD